MPFPGLIYSRLSTNFALQPANTMTSKTKKISFISVGVFLLLIALSILYFGSRTSQTDLSAERNQGVLGELLLDSEPQFIVLRPGLRFKLDTGADFSSITERDLHFLDSLGYKATESFYPIIGRDGKGDIKLNTKRYTVSLPLYMWDTSTDSLGTVKQDINYNASNVLSNIDFAPSDCEFSVLGIDFIEKFIVEFRSKENVLAFYFDQPEGYETGARIERSQSPLYWPYLGHRYYMTAGVDSEDGYYFLDTGIMRAFIHRPLRELPVDLQKTPNDTIVSFHGKYPAVADHNGWLKIGNREGNETIYYYDSDEESHSINPLNMLDNVDLLLDFPSQQLGFKK